MNLLSLDRRINKAVDPTVGELVTKYGTNINRLTQDVAAGKVDPTKALMVKMTIQRIISANTQPQAESTVAQDYGMAYGGQVAVSNNQIPAPAMERGLTGIPIPDNMFDYAEGGIVAFGDGGDVKRFDRGGLSAERIAARQVSPFPNSSVADLFSRQQSLIPPYMFDDDMNYRRMLERMTIDDLKELARKTPMTVPGTGETNPRFKAIEEIVRSRTPYAAPPMQSRAPPPIPGSIGPYSPPPVKGAPLPPIPGPTPAPVERSGVYKAGQAVGRGLSGVSKLFSEGLVSIAPKAAGALSVLPYFFESTDLNVGEEETLQGLARQRLRSLGYSDEQINKIPRNELTRFAATATQVVQQAEAPQADTTKKDTKAEEKARVDTAVSEARRIMEPPRIAEIAEPPRMTVPQEKDIEVETEAAMGLAGRLVPMPVDADKSLDQILKSDRETLAKQGYDFNMIKNMVAETRAEREKIPEQRKEAANLRLLEAGLAIMGGTSPYAFVNIGKGGSEAAKGFNEDMKEFRKLDREYRKELQQLQNLQNQETLMLTTEGKKRYERIQDKVEQTKLKRAEVAFSIGQNAVKNSTEDRRAAEAINAALDRTIFTTKQQRAQAEAEMRSRENIAAAQIAAQKDIAGRPAAEVQLIERIQNDPEFAKAYQKAMEFRYAPRAEADLREEYTKNYLILSKQYPTFEDYKKAMTQAGGTKGVDYKGRYGLE